MYAVIETGGKQYRVELGSRIQVDRLDVRPGESIRLERVLLVGDGDATAVGRPLVDGASVSAEVLGQDRGEKVVVFKYKPKARTRVKKGFRAELTTLRISDIAFGGRSAAMEAEKAEASRSKEQQAAAQAAEQQAAADRALASRLAATEATEATAETADAAGSATRRGAAAKSSPKKAPKAAPEAEPETAEAAPEPAPEAEPEVVEAAPDPETATAPAGDEPPDAEPTKDE